MNKQQQLASLGLFDAKVPRYTSYPTAPHFSNDVDPNKFGQWIKAIPQGSEISLYLHVPFCRRLCWFCACRTQGTTSVEPVKAYLETLKQELRILRNKLPADVSLSRLHWGGGTPTLMSADMMTELANAVLEVAPLSENAEFSVEIDPNEIDDSRLDALAAAGMNRASVGIQDFNEEIQATIGRMQSYEITRSAIEKIRARGIHSLNADILYGLPNQTNERITESVQKLLSLSPDRVALYGYAHVPWMARRQNMIPSDQLPTPQERLQLFETARKLFTWDGYSEIGIDHFALKGDGLETAQTAGKLRRNFQGYTDDQANVLIGVGASSISRFPQGFAQNDASTSKHTGAIRNGQFSTTRGHSFSKDDRLRGRIIEALMCDFKVSASEIVRDFDITSTKLRAYFDDVNRAFDGLLKVSDEMLFIPEAVRPLTRIIARHFDAYDMAWAKHSSAI
ncbi:MAG: oxygen-independent coproporphyrinogen III oxidase [Paracoccaceae bacterium]|nr:oxygen-independent coproporphyrinogen III oxidase [Paracoccaceae bacterium]MDG2260365.1 oxygen-independent coproporphyrinogen III oxidase [Paracoccaceae bacterium]